MIGETPLAHIDFMRSSTNICLSMCVCGDPKLKEEIKNDHDDPIFLWDILHKYSDATSTVCIRDLDKLNFAMLVWHQGLML